MANLPPPPRDAVIQTRYDDEDNDGYFENNLAAGYANDEGGYTGTQLYNINTEELYNNNNNGFGLPMNSEPLSPSVVNGNRGLLSMKNNNNIANHKLDTMSEQLNTLVEMQNMRKSDKSIARESDVIKMEQKPNQKQNKTFWFLWNIILFILLLFTVLVNIHYMLFRVPCKRVLKKDHNQMLADANALSLLTQSPTIIPTNEPSISPTYQPSTLPTDGPTKTPSVTPTDEPSNVPTITPTKTPSITPTKTPSSYPSETPTINPTKNPTAIPTKKPTGPPSFQISSNEVIPVGGIVMYADCGNIPEGWELCNGSGNCPDLRGKFIVGGGNGFNYGDSGNIASHTHGYSASGSLGNYRLTINDIPAHNHHNGAYRYMLRSNCDRTYYYFFNAPDNTCGEPNLLNQGEQLSNGGNQVHSHGFSINSATASRSHLPPYYALCYIMKTQQQTWNTNP